MGRGAWQVTSMGSRVDTTNTALLLLGWERIHLPAVERDKKISKEFPTVLHIRSHYSQVDVPYINIT